MTREAFIRKWLGNTEKPYSPENRDEMRDDLDKVINNNRPETINFADMDNNNEKSPLISTTCLLEVIDKLPHSKSRVPYTYHYDYLRQHSKAHSGMSRSDVASSHTADYVELHAIALTQILSEVGADAIYLINSNDVLICKKAKEITEAAVSRYNCC